DKSISLGFTERGAIGADIKDIDDNVIDQVRLPTFYLASSDIQSDETIGLARGTFHLMNDTFFSNATIRPDAPAGEFGTDLVPDADRTITNNIQLSQHLTFRGEHSVELTGFIYQTNRRAITNLLAEGETLTISGEGISIVDEHQIRDIMFDG